MLFRYWELMLQLGVYTSHEACVYVDMHFMCVYVCVCVYMHLLSVHTPVSATDSMLLPHSPVAMVNSFGLQQVHSMCVFLGVQLPALLFFKTMFICKHVCLYM